MPRVTFPPKYAVETRTDKLDFSPFIPAGGSVSSAVAVVAVWSGADPTPTLTATPTPATPYVNNVLAGGVLGVIYLVTVRATLSTGDVIPLSYYLAVVPDAP